MNPIQWGDFGTDAVRAQKRIRDLWDLGHNTHTISKATSIPEPKVDRVVTDYLTRKRVLAGKPT